MVWIGVAMSELQAAPPGNPLFRGAFSFGSPEVELLEMCLDVLEGIRHEVQRSGLTQPTKVRELGKAFVAFLASLRESTFGMNECAMLTAEGEACETKLRLKAGCMRRALWEDSGCDVFALQGVFRFSGASGDHDSLRCLQPRGGSGGDLYLQALRSDVSRFLRRAPALRSRMER